MKRLVCGSAVLALLLAGAAASESLGAWSALTAKEVMGKLNKGPDCLKNKLNKALKGQADWDDIQAKAKEYVELTEALAKAEPKKGEAESWTKLTGGYVKNAKALEAAAMKKDPKAAQAAMKKLSDGANCKACHDQHK